MVHKQETILYAVSLFLILLLLSLYPDICINGASRGLLTWFNTVLPSLFPFFVVTRLILSMNLIPGKISAIYPVITGLVAGYPSGAVTVAETVKSGHITPESGQILMIISNNASPGFLIGIAGCISEALSDRPNPFGKYIIWFCVIASSAFVTVVCMFFSRLKHEHSTAETTAGMYGKKYVAAPVRERKAFLPLLEDTIMQCAKILVLIGGYIIIFSILADYINMIISDYTAKCAITGIFEITCGVTLALVSAPETDALIRGIIIAALCGFGGISSILQTAGPARQASMSVVKYIIHKIICATISGALFWFIMH